MNDYEKLCIDMLKWFEWARSTEGLALSGAAENQRERENARKRFTARLDAIREASRTEPMGRGGD